MYGARLPGRDLLRACVENPQHARGQCGSMFCVMLVLLDFSLIVKAAPQECVIRTGQP